MHAPAIQDRCWDGFQFIPTDIKFFKLLQFGHFTKRNGGKNYQFTIRQFKWTDAMTKRTHDFKDSLTIVIFVNIFQCCF